MDNKLKNLLSDTLQEYAQQGSERAQQFLNEEKKETTFTIDYNRVENGEFPKNHFEKCQVKVEITPLDMGRERVQLTAVCPPGNELKLAFELGRLLQIQLDRHLLG